MKRILILATVLVLTLSVALQAYSFFRPVSPASISQPLAEKLPVAPPGFTHEDHPLGHTESLQARSMDLLRLDDFIFREYYRGGRSFSVYVAYWEPGKMPVRLVNSHNPDRCWTQVGWVCEDLAFNVETTAGEEALLPAQWRQFEKDGYEQYVLFWHIVDGEVYSYDRFSNRPPLTVIFTDLLRNGLNVKREQFFVRVTSREPLENWENDPFYEEVLQALARLCLDGEGESLAAQRPHGTSSAEG